MALRRYNLPVGWMWTDIKSVSISIQYGHTASANSAPVGPKFLRITDIQNDSVDWENVPFCICTEDELEKYNLKTGDIVFARTGATTGKSFLISRCPQAIFASYLIRLSLDESVYPTYLKWYFCSTNYWVQITDVKKGSAQPGVNATVLARLDIPLPPLAEQHRIVAEIEELFSALDASVAALKAAQEQLKVYRQAVLKYAFEGRLTEAWREAQRKAQVELPDAADLLTEIQAERTRRYEQQLDDWSAEVVQWEANGKPGRKPKKPRAPKVLPPLSEDDLAGLPESLEGWCWIRVDDLANVETGATPLKRRSDYYNGGTIPWVTSTSLNSEYIREGNDFITTKALIETNVKLFPKHTLLVAMYGEGKTRGKCSELLIQATTNQAIAALVQQGTEESTRPYVKHFMLKNYQDIRRESSGGVQPNLNLDIIKHTWLPLAPLVEQKAIVAEIEARLSIVDNLETTITTSLEQAAALRQSILKQAFEGKLVPQDPNDEPAEKLLERIQAERIGNVNQSKMKSTQPKSRPSTKGQATQLSLPMSTGESA